MALTSDQGDDEQSPPDVLQGRVISIVPFVVLAVASELSLLLPPGPTSNGDAYLSAGLLALTAALYVLVPRILPRRWALATPLCYLASVLLLILAAGGTSAGIGLIVLLPILWVALTMELWESFFVVLAVLVVELVTTYSPVDLSGTVRLRREVSYLFVGGLIVASIQELRQRYQRSLQRRDTVGATQDSTIQALGEQARVGFVINEMVDMLNFCDVVEEAYDVFEYAARQIFLAGGSIYILNSRKDKMESKCSWPGHDTTSDSFSLDQCFALELGQPYASDAEHARCAHFPSDERLYTWCYPLLINREDVGLLVALVPASIGSLRKDAGENYRQYARMIGDQISIWLANFKLRESLKNLSIRDPLTNLFNRRFMIETLNREMAITARNHEQTSVIQIDIDHFKEFNDTFGHDVGDAVLQAVADVMFGLFRESDVPCRSGGEEFTLILPRCSWQVANVRALELQLRVAAMTIRVPENRPQPRPPTLSIGIATSPEHGRTGDELRHGADEALYVAKNAGRNRIEPAALIGRP